MVKGFVCQINIIMARGEISWKRTDDEGKVWQVCAHHFGGDWIFYSRQRRFDQWHAQKDATLEDWLEVLDGVRRRVARRLMTPKEEERVKAAIIQRFPKAADSIS
jgi:hypothetical protein